jgi:DNA primase
MDCIAVAASGIENVVASCCTSLTEGQIRLLGRYTRRVVVNYDPDSAGMAATERSLALLLEAGFEAKVLALPGGLDPDEFIRKRGAAAYGELLKNAPSYLDYLTERAAKTHDIRSPEGKVAAVNAILPYLIKVPNPMLRAELAGRLAERLRVDERLLRDELRRAAGEKRTEVHVTGEVTADANHAVKQLLRACLESEELADAVLPEVMASGATDGLASENVFKQLWEARQRSEKLNLAESDGVLSAAEKRLAFDALFWPGAPLTLEQAQGYLRALKFQRLQRERDKLLRAIEAAVKAQDAAQLAELQRAKLNIDRELRKLGRP